MPEANRTDESRPDPDALLALAGSGRGRLTLFLGAAPGVGKTYAMLSRAKRLKAEGVDIVVGLAETHGRSETAGLLEGLDVLPRRKIDHQGRIIEEFDLDAALARKPKLIIVDELAHTNAPDSRHPKRYLDIEELLDAGINVWSAMNVQHLESLSDVVQQITGIQVRERVPDIFLQKADDVLLVDLSPAELLERLKEGKVYLPENARRAEDSFFRLGNLTALREMALRRTADRVDDQVVDYLRQNAIAEPWLVADRLLVCIGPDVLSERVVRTAARLASGLNAPWLVVTVERADKPPGGAEAASRLEATLKLATSLGAETRRITGNDFVAEILKVARRERSTQIVIGGRRPRFPYTLFSRSLPDALIEQVSGVALHIVTADDAGASNSAAPAIRRFRFGMANPLLELGLPAVSVAAATLLGSALVRMVDLPNVSLIYLLAVLISANYAGYLSALVAALLSALAYNYFFIQPTGSLTIAAPHEVFGLAVFVIAALIAGGVASRIRQQATATSTRAASTQSLYDFSRKLSGTANADEVLWATVTQLRSSLTRDAVLLWAPQGELSIAAAWPPDTDLDVTDMAAARWVLGKNEAAGNGTGTLPNSAFQFRPLSTPAGIAAVVGYRVGETALSPEEEQTIGAILDQAGIAIDRARLSRESLEQATRLAGDRFRSSLLSSISHDLKTPLATITGAVSSLRQLGDRMKPESRADLLVSIEEESERLARFVANLLDMTRIEAGSVDAKRDWVDIADLVQSSLQRAAKSFPRQKIEISLEPALPLIRGDSVLLGQVLFNLIDNAIKYGGEPISIFARREASDVVIAVTDMGKGIPPKEIDHIFEKFFRRAKPDGRTPGTGLGLAIAKGFVEAMGGAIRAESPAVRKRGTRITLRFLVPTQDIQRETTS